MTADVELGRAARFLARLDRHLSALADEPARFLERQLEGSEHRYARFVATEGASEPISNPADPPQASDFLLTIGRPCRPPQRAGRAARQFKRTQKLCKGERKCLTM